jgi:hypothetical protein
MGMYWWLQLAELRIDSDGWGIHHLDYSQLCSTMGSDGRAMSVEATHGTSIIWCTVHADIFVMLLFTTNLFNNRLQQVIKATVELIGNRYQQRHIQMLIKDLGLIDQPVKYHSTGGRTKVRLSSTTCVTTYGRIELIVLNLMTPTPHGPCSLSRANRQLNASIKRILLCTMSWAHLALKPILVNNQYS